MRLTGARVPALDGLRGVALILVLAAHLEIPGTHDGGKTGVAVFFALSGFLITSLLFDEHDHGGIRLAAFYRRRALRLLPAQLVCVVLLTAFLASVAAPAILWTPGASLGALLYLTDFQSSSTVFGHFWSLAVEEQFYLLWAPAVLVLMRRHGRGALAALGLAVAVLAVVTRVGMSDHWSFPAGLVVNLDGLLIGAAAAALGLRRKMAAVASPRWSAYCLVLLLALTALPLSVGQSWGPAAAAVVTVVMIATAREDVGWLTWSPLRLVGLRSYGLYLWHYPVLLIGWQVAGRTEWLVSTLMTVPVTWLLAAASWRWVETPFLAMRPRLGRLIQEGTSGPRRSGP